MVSADHFENYFSQMLHISHNDWSYNPYRFWVTRSKVNVKGAVNVFMVSAQCLENYLSQNLHISHIDW
jgi:hypothetical protein